MTCTNFSKFIQLSSLYILIILICNSCQNEQSVNQSFLGQPDAIELAEKMFEAIGGKEAWCQTRSIYIKAEHTEPDMNIPYTSEIWRDLDVFDLQIEQQNDSFHVKARMDINEGIVNYLDKRDTSRILTKEQLEDWNFGHDHNVYVLLHHIACEPEAYEVGIDDDGRLNFSLNGIFSTGFFLDDQHRPYMFYAPNSDGTIQGSKFTKWGTDGGLVHSAGGHPLDSSFVYTTELWIPSKLSLKESLRQGLFKD